MVPNESALVKKLYDTGVFDLRTDEGQGAFTDAVVSALHAKDERWGHLKKNASQTHVHGHGEDAALYLSDRDGESCAVDFIGGAGGPNPQPAWNVDSPRYSKKDWRDPFDHGYEQTPPPAPPPLRIPSYGELGDDAFFRAMIGVPLQADMLQAGQSLNDGSSVWFSRLTYRLMKALIEAKGAPIDALAEVRIVRNEWRAILGLPPV